MFEFTGVIYVEGWYHFRNGDSLTINDELPSDLPKTNPDDP